MNFNKIAVMTFFSLSASVVLAQGSTKIDLTSPLNGIEKSCIEGNPEIVKIVNWLTSSKVAPSVTNAPASVKSAVIKVDTAKKGSLVHYSVKLNATYKGLELKSIERDVDAKDEYQVISLLFADKQEMITKKLGKIIHNPNSDTATPQLLTSKQTSTAAIVCDFSL